MRFGFGHFPPVFAHLAVGADPHCGADNADSFLAVQHLFAIGRVLFHYLAFGIGEQDEGQTVLTRKCGMGCAAVC